MKKIGIIGFGRFGKVLAQILQKGFDTFVYDLNSKEQHDRVIFTSLENILKMETIFICVPIRELKNVIQNIRLKLNLNTTIIDVCSVKLYPKEIMEKYLPENIGYIASHPLFGPDSFSFNKNLKMMMSPEKDIYNVFEYWADFFRGQGIEIINITPDMHDKLAANSQGITHFIGRSLTYFGAKRTIIDTKGFRSLLNLMEQTCNDTKELYEDLQVYNPYTKEMIKKIKDSIYKQTEFLENSQND
ncbi:MAG: prephenate dehydrogenase [Candidatus Marinimicrobia bacterium]|nr:prephenate dehydrogenase [Candidatus Neomarinimicrobiota bacterium]|tara:strand:+ start:913 stop:1644 length:732 start_codon:yes stop_codon:yes gene_type:complete